MLPGDLLDLREKALGLTALRRVGSDATGLRTEPVFVVGAHGRDSCQNCRKRADFFTEARFKAEFLSVVNALLDQKRSSKG